MSTTGSNTYRVWMKDGRWKLIEATDIDDALRKAKRRWRGRVVSVKTISKASRQAWAAGSSQTASPGRPPSFPLL
jgi:hypothetical protein